MKMVDLAVHVLQLFFHDSSIKLLLILVPRLGNSLAQFEPGHLITATQGCQWARPGLRKMDYLKRPGLPGPAQSV